MSAHRDDVPRGPVRARSAASGRGLIPPTIRCSDTVTSADTGCTLGPFSFSLYDIPMVSEEQIQTWAEAGYDVDELKRRGRGRPGRGAEPMQVVALRLTAEELDALDAAAAKHDMTRSEAIRAALAHFAA